MADNNVYSRNWLVIWMGMGMGVFNFEMFLKFGGYLFFVYFELDREIPIFECENGLF